MRLVLVVLRCHYAPPDSMFLSLTTSASVSPQPLAHKAVIVAATIGVADAIHCRNISDTTPLLNGVERRGVRSSEQGGEEDESEFHIDERDFARCVEKTSWFV
ncbi:hypothetical protein CPB83DRAFT_865119 [Crepidotus variabilis]|uniref:Uncharacterized protein n=1 Tax=Crepidotus variabilis TaxID=179855 RepID=A0A9P6E3V2_9AGAR|nr:hypothetical protein CPB83DRAFT_865119 [Crepidotus variabilis]